MIEKANEKDIPELLKMGECFFVEAKQNEFFEWDEGNFHLALKDLTKNPFVFLVARNKDEIIGAVCAILFPLWFNRSIIVAQELFLYVKPESRKGIGLKLLKKLEEEVKNRNAKNLIMLSFEEMPSLDKLYERNGYRKSEKTVIKRL